MAFPLAFIHNVYSKLRNNLVIKQGFTLIEVAVFTLAISIVAASTLPPIIEKRVKEQRNDVTISQLKDVGDLAEDYYNQPDLSDENEDPHYSFSEVNGKTLCLYIISRDDRYDGKIWGKGCDPDTQGWKSGDYSQSRPRYLKVQAANGQNLAIYGKSLSGDCFVLTRPKGQPVTTTNNVQCPSSEDETRNNNENIDDIKPVVTITSPANGSSTGDSSIIITYTATDNSGQTPTCNIASGAQINLIEGPNNITITCRDASNNVKSAHVTVTRTDTTPPEVNIMSPSNNHSTEDSSVVITYTATDSSGTPTCTRTVNGGASTSITTGDSVNLRGGSNTIIVTCVDASNNEGSDQVIITRNDDTPPVVEITSPSNGATIPGGSVVVTFNASDNIDEELECNIESGDSVPLNSGSNTITVTCVDDANNEGEDSVTVSGNDTTPPEVTIISPADYSSTTNSSVTLVISATDNSGATPTCNKNSGDSIPLNFGSNTISVTCTDASDNETTVSTHVTRLDNTPPTLTITAPSNNSSTSNSSVAVTFTTSDDSGATPTCTRTVNGGSSTSITSGDSVNLSYGSNAISVTCTDGSNNDNTKSVNITRLDTTPPEVTITAPTNYNQGNPASSPSGSIFNSNNAVLTFTSSDNSNDYSCNKTSGSSLNSTSGLNTVSVTCTDAQNNQTTESVTYYYVPMNDDSCVATNFKKALVAQIKYNYNNRSSFATTIEQLQSVDNSIDFSSCSGSPSLYINVTGTTITEMAVSDNSTQILYKISNFTPGTTPTFQCQVIVTTGFSANCPSSRTAAGGGYLPVGTLTTYTWDPELSTFTGDSTLPTTTINSLDGTTQTAASITLSISATDNSGFESCNYWNGDNYNLASLTVGTGKTLTVNCSDPSYNVRSVTATFTYYPAVSKVIVGRISSTSNCAIRVNGSVYCWGNNTNGKLGDGTTTQRTVPTPVSGLSNNVTEVVTDGNTFCAIQSGAVKCWGTGSSGQMGNGNSTTSNPTPVQVNGLTSGVTSIAMGSTSVCAIQSGAVKCWGGGASGKLGNGGTSTSNVPVQVIGLTSNVTKIDFISSTACAIHSGAVKCWGVGSSGQMGNGTTTATNSSPVSTSTLTSNVTDIRITGNGSTVCATQSGAAYCWGLGTSGQIGNGSSTTRTTPGAVNGLTSGVTQLSSGQAHNCAIQSGSVKCWGTGTNGQLGSGTVNSNVPITPSGMTGTTLISGGGSNTCIIRNSLGYCWGANSNGQVGNGSTATSVSTPYNVDGGNPYMSDISTNGATSCGVYTGFAYCWGLGTSGQIGNNGTTSVSSPVLILGQTN